MSCTPTNGRRNPRGHHRGHTSAWPMSHYISIFLTSPHSSPRWILGTLPISHARNLLVRKVPHRNPREPRPSRPPHRTRLIALSSVPLSLLSAYPSLNDWTDFKRKQCSKPQVPVQADQQFTYTVTKIKPINRSDLQIQRNR